MASCTSPLKHYNSPLKEGWRPVPATPRRPSPLLRLLPSGSDRVHSLLSRGDRYRPP